MGRLFRALLVLAVIGAPLGWYLTIPERSDAAVLEAVEPDPVRGKYVFTAGGCASCHQTPDVEDSIHLGGGEAFSSPFGTFYAPNISPSDQGIGNWEPIDLVNALHHGTSPDGQHYYPAFPYTSYQNMTVADATSLYAYLITLPPVDSPNRAHEVAFPFDIRRALGGWKLLFMPDDWVMPADTPDLKRGRYLVEALGHCAECHTPRNTLGGLNTSAWLSGAPNPSGRGNIPDITPDELTWSDADLRAYLTTGFTPDYDVVGGSMAHVVENLEKLPDEDITAIIAYLRALT